MCSTVALITPIHLNKIPGNYYMLERRQKVKCMKKKVNALFDIHEN